MYPVTRSFHFFFSSSFSTFFLSSILHFPLRLIIYCKTSVHHFLVSSLHPIFLFHIQFFFVFRFSFFFPTLLHLSVNSIKTFWKYRSIFISFFPLAHISLSCNFSSSYFTFLFLSFHLKYVTKMSIERKIGFRSRAISCEKCRSFCTRTRRRWISSSTLLYRYETTIFFFFIPTLRTYPYFSWIFPILYPLSSLPFSSAGDYVFYIRYTHTLIHKHTYTRKKYLLRMSRVILSVVSILMIANHPLVANDQ